MARGTIKQNVVSITTSISTTVDTFAHIADIASVTLKQELLETKSSNIAEMLTLGVSIEDIKAGGDTLMYALAEAYRSEEA